MKTVLYILFGWLLTSWTAWALGAALLRMLKIRLHRVEEIGLGFVTGAACLSTLLFWICSLRIAHKGVFLALAAAATLLLLKTRGAGSLPAADCQSAKRRLAIYLVFAAFGILYFFNSLAPETSPDGAGYHIPVAELYYRAHGFVRANWNMYANMPEGIELLFMMAFAFGRQSAAAMVHFSFLLALPLLMLASSRRFGIPAAGAAAAAIVFVTPVIGIDGTSAYVDVALAAGVFGMFYCLQLWDCEGDARLLIPAGILAGFAFAIKYTGFVAIPYAIGFVLWRCRHRLRSMLRPAAVMAGLAIAVSAPWLVKNALFVRNPIAPFANSVFRNPNFHISAERDYRNYLRMYDLTSYRELPLELTVRGERLAGLYGPLFLLAPLALLSLANPLGRQLLLAALVFGSTYFGNIGARFLIPVAPFIALALAVVLARVPGLLMIAVLFHALSSWPGVLPKYCAQYAWRLRDIPVGPALRRPPDDVYLSETWPPYLVDRLLDRETPPGARVFSFGAIAESYTSRQVLVSTNAAQNEVLGDILLTPVIKDFQPGKIVDFQFPARAVRSVRVVRTAGSGEAQWNVAEVRVFAGGRELPRHPQWGLTANPNPWDVQLAFDNSLVTRWRSWEPSRPGMFIEIDFGATRTIDTVDIETSDEASMRVDADDGTGGRRVLSASPTLNSRPVESSLRLAATEELKLRGIRYLLVDASNYGADDFFRYPAAWGLKELGRAAGSRLFLIQ